MKQKLFYILMLFCITYPMSAQECVLCGDWVGNFTDPYFPENDDVVKVSFTRTIRITCKDDNYDVKMKTTRNDNNDVRYYNGAQITHSDENSISWYYLLMSSYDWDSSDKFNGVTIGHVDFYSCCKVIIDQGVLKYIEYHKRLYYDRRGNYIGEWTGRKSSYKNGILHKEEPNW